MFEGVPHYSVSAAELTEGISSVELLAAKTAVFPSKGEAKKMIQAGGTSINKTKVASIDQVYGQSDLINGKFLIAQKGKKNYFLIIAE